MITLRSNASDLTKRRFGRLIAIEPDHRIKLEPKGSVIVWLCECDCGQKHLARAGDLRSGSVSSCGCIAKDARKRAALWRAGRAKKIRVPAAESPFRTPEERVIAGCPFYTVTANGEVYSYQHRRNLTECPRKRLTPHFYKTSGGALYEVVTLYKADGTVKPTLVHRLVAFAFLGPPTGNDHLVRHLDGNSRNNCDWNLAWGTYKDNEADKKRHGRHLKREGHPMAKLNSAKVDAVRAMYRAGYTSSDIGKFLGMAKSSIAAVVTGKTWPEPPLTPLDQYGTVQCIVF